MKKRFNLGKKTAKALNTAFTIVAAIGFLGFATSVASIYEPTDLFSGDKMLLIKVLISSLALALIGVVIEGRSSDALERIGKEF